MKIIFFSLMTLLSTHALAGDKGNGGISVVCKNKSGEMISAELLDIYEGRILGGKIYGKNADRNEKLADTLLKLFPHKEFLELIKKNLSYIEANMIFVPEGHELLPTDDAHPVIRKKGCALEQLANFTDEGEIYVSQVIYETLDEVNKAAFLLHEAIYATRRTMGDQNSQKSRRLVYELMAEKTNMEVVKRLINPTILRPGSFVQHKSDFCKLELADDGWSFIFRDNRKKGSCPNTGKVIELKMTETKNLLYNPEGNEYILVTSEKSFIATNILRDVEKKRGYRYIKVK